jgi:hypothetical protein
VKAVALAAGVALLIVAMCLLTIVVFPGTNTDRDTWLGALIFLVMAVAVAVVADVLIIIGLRQPATTTPIQARGKRSGGRLLSPGLILAAPLVLTIILVGTVTSWLARAVSRTGGHEVGNPKTLTPFAQGDRAKSDWDDQTAQPAPARDRPAIAAMLFHDVSLQWEAAVIATLLDLAARRYVRFTEESGRLWCRAPGTRPAESLVRFERLLLDHIDGRLAAGDAPIQALLPDYQDEEGNFWFGRFQAAVREEAHRLGLISSPRSRSTGGRFVATASGADPATVSHWRAIGERLVTAAQRPLEPESGAAVNDPMLPWAIATGVAEGTLQAMLPSAPWSSFGNHWHVVNVPRRSKGRVPRWSLRRGKPDQRMTFTARVIRRWTRTDSSEYGTYTHYFLAVDDGSGGDALVHRVTQDQYRSTRHDGDLRVTVDHKGRLADLVQVPGVTGSQLHP